MKRIALSLAVIVGSAVYVLEQPRGPSPDEPLAAAPSEDVPPAGGAVGLQEAPKRHLPGAPPATLAIAGSAAGASKAPASPSPSPLKGGGASVLSNDDEAEDDEGISAAVAELIKRTPLPRLRVAPLPPKAKPAVAKGGAPVVRVAVSAPPAAGHADGSFIGSVENAYYGLVQVEALFAQGKLVSVRVLRYPSDRRTSVYINSRAIPALRREAIAAQSANIDIVSGATLTSRAFARSLDAALNRAGA